MSNLEHEIRVALAEMVPPLNSEEPDWIDVLYRASELSTPSRSSPRRPWMRRAILATTVAIAIGLVASPVGWSWASDAVHTISSWITGDPGTPATRTEQERFDAEREGATFSFPAGTKLRRLSRISVRGSDFQLFGFRSRADLCLRVERLNDGYLTAPYCIARARVEQGPLVIPVAVGLSLPGRTDGRAGILPAALAFGFVKGDATAMEAITPTARLRAAVDSNTFLIAYPSARSGQAVRAFSVEYRSGSGHVVPIEHVFAGPRRESAQDLEGPTRIEHKVSGGSIDWVLEREAVGEPLPAGGRAFLRGVGRVVFARVLRPDPRGNNGVVVAVVASDQGIVLCQGIAKPLLGLAGGCSPVSDVFSAGPTKTSVSMQASAGADVTVSGLASDDVSRLELYASDGTRHTIPLSWNVFALDIGRAALPAKLVALDDNQRVIGIESIPLLGTSATDARPILAEKRKILQVVGPGGDRASLSIAPSTLGGVCYWLRLPRGAGRSACEQPGFRRLEAAVLGLGPYGRDVFLFAAIPRRSRQVEIRYRDGTSKMLSPRSGFILYALPLVHHRPPRRPSELIVQRLGGKAPIRLQIAPASQMYPPSS